MPTGLAREGRRRALFSKAGPQGPAHHPPRLRGATPPEKDEEIVDSLPLPYTVAPPLEGGNGSDVGLNRQQQFSTCA